MTDTMIEAHSLAKRYGDVTAVDGIDFSVQKGQVFGLLGPNGSGKTTTILMLLGLTEPSSGEVRVLGLDPARKPLSVKRRVGYLPDQVGFYDGLTARQNLTYIARLNGLPRDEASARINEGLQRMGLADVADKPVKTFSRGMRQRLAVAELLLKQPQIIIMDEPTLGLDPDAARLFINIIRELRDEGITMLLSSHLLHQVQEVCDHVALFRHGRILAQGTVEELARRVLRGGYNVVLEVENGSPALETKLAGIPQVLNVQHLEPTRYVLEATADVRPQAAEAAVTVGGRLQGLKVEVPDLDEIYARYFEQEVDYAAA